MQHVDTIPTKKPMREPVLEDLLDALGVRHKLWRNIAREAQERVAQGIAPGRVTLAGPHNMPTSPQYSHPLVAACDWHRWQREIEHAGHESVLAAALDDVAAGWGDEAAVRRAQFIVERSRERMRRIERLWPLTEYASLQQQLFFATLEVMMLEPDAHVHRRYAPMDIATPLGTSRHPFRQAEAHDHGRAAAARMAARENAALDAPTKYSMAKVAVRDLEARLGRWREANEMLAAMIVADGDRGIVQW